MLSVCECHSLSPSAGTTERPLHARRCPGPAGAAVTRRTDRLLASAWVSQTINTETQRRLAE